MAQKLVEGTTKDNVEHRYEAILKKLEKTFNDHEIKLSEKQDYIMPYLWALTEIDKNLGLRKDNRLIIRSFKDNNGSISDVFYEAFAYMAHKDGSPKVIGELFKLASSKERKIKDY